MIGITRGNIRCPALAAMAHRNLRCQKLGFYRTHPMFVDQLLRNMLSCLVLVGLCATTEIAHATDIMFLDAFDGPPYCAPAGIPGCPGFEVVTPAVAVSATDPSVYCYYTTLPNAADVAIGRIWAELGPSMAYTIVYTTRDASDGHPVAMQADGTLLNAPCELVSGNVSAYWLYRGHRSFESLELPINDGAGLPLAIELPPGQPLAIEMHFWQAAMPAQESVSLSLIGYGKGATYTQTASLVTYDVSLNLPSGLQTTVSGSCPVPIGTRFWRFSTYTHKYAVDARAEVGATVIVDSIDWTRPNVASYAPPSFFQFGSGEELGYSCTFNNTSPDIIAFGMGDNGETCTVVSYFFPATRPLTCVVF